MAIKSSRGVTSGKGIPQGREGQNGDLTVRTSRKGKHLYVKDINRWHAVTLNIDTAQMQTHVDRLLQDVKRLKTKQNNSPILDKVIFRKPGSANVQLKNDSASLSVRNAAATALAELKVKHLKLPTDISGVSDAAK